MSCAKKGDVLVIFPKYKMSRKRGLKLGLVDGKYWKVVFLKHDTEGFPKEDALVVYAGTRHIARVPLKWLKRPKG